MFFLLHTIFALQLDSLESRLESGKAHYSLYTSSGSCWESAILSMQSSCSSMDESTQSDFASKLTNCHLSRLNLPQIPCKIGQCQLDATTYLAYTHFFTHTFDICVYISYQNWQKRTQQTVQDLTITSQSTLKTLQSSTELSQRILTSQNLMKNSLEDSIKGHKDLQEEVGKSREEIEAFTREFVFRSQEMEKEIGKQKEFIAGWFEKVFDLLGKVNSVQGIVMEELWELSFLVFLAIFLAFVTILTSFSETYSLRFRLYALGVAEGIAEKLLGGKSVGLRMGLVGVTLCIAALGVKRFQDYDRLSYCLLKENLRKEPKSVYLMTPGKKHLINLTQNSDLRTGSMKKMLNNLKGLQSLLE